MKHYALIRIFQSVDYKQVLSVRVPCKAPSFPASVLCCGVEAAFSPLITPHPAQLCPAAAAGVVRISRGSTSPPPPHTTVCSQCLLALSRRITSLQQVEVFHPVFELGERILGL